MILCDTNILIEFFRGNLRIVEELRGIGPDQLAISVITQAELYFGALNKRELAQLRRHLTLLHVLSIDQSVSHRFIHLMENFALSHKLSIPDALIAATALEHQLALYTLNLKDFRFIPELQLYTPLRH